MTTLTHFERHDTLGLLHRDNGPALVDVANNKTEYYWHGLLTKSVYGDPFDISKLPDGFTMFRDVLYHIKNGQLNDYKNGRAAFTKQGKCYSVRHGRLVALYHDRHWYDWNIRGMNTEHTNDDRIGIDNRNIYYEYLSSTDKITTTKHEYTNSIYFHDRFDRLHNVKGPAIIHVNGTLEYWEFGLWKQTVNPDGTIRVPQGINSTTTTTKDGLYCHYNNAGQLHDYEDGRPAVVGSGNKKWFTNDVLTKEEIAGKLYLVSDGVHTEIVEINALVNMTQFQAEYPGTELTQAELDNKVRMFLNTYLTPKQKLQAIANRFLKDADELQVWKEVHSELLNIMNSNYDLVTEFIQQLGFRKLSSFTSYWRYAVKAPNSDKILKLRDDMYKHYTKQVVEGTMDLYGFMRILSGLPLNELVEDLIKDKCETNVNWRLVIQACHEDEITFDCLVRLFNLRYFSEEKSNRYIYNFLVKRLELDCSFDVRGKLSDMMLL